MNYSDFGIPSKDKRDIPAFIAEGCGKLTSEEAGRSIGGAVALANRLEYYALMARDLQMLSQSNHDLLVDCIVEVRKMLSGFAKRVQG